MLDRMDAFMISIPVLYILINLLNEIHKEGYTTIAIVMAFIGFVNYLNFQFIPFLSIQIILLHRFHLFFLFDSSFFQKSNKKCAIK